MVEIGQVFSNTQANLQSKILNSNLENITAEIDGAYLTIYFWGESTIGSSVSLSGTTNITLSSDLTLEEEIVIDKLYNNEYMTSPIPQSEFQYAWINNAVSGSGWEGDQNILGYARKDGKFRTTDNKLVPAINFPTASTIVGV